MRLIHLIAVTALVAGVTPVARSAAQDAKPAAPPPPPAASAPKRLTVGPLDVGIAWRSRVESWGFFEGASGDSSYTFPHSQLRVSVGQTRPRVTWSAEVAQITLLALPEGGVAPAPLGQLGLGGSYYASNGGRTNVADVFLKQGYVQFNKLGASTLKLGRFEFFDGSEATVPDPVVARVVQTRITHRLVSNFGFTAVQRSFDGAQWRLANGPHTVNVLAMRPTQGVFQAAGMKGLDVDLGYASYSHTTNGKRSGGALRLFGIGYMDHRTAALKTDNRSAAVRAADHDEVSIGSVGGDYVARITTRSGPVDVLVWGVGQFGSWGTQTHRASALVGEVGWQPKLRFAPWVRGGYSYGSGDASATDAKHGTFFQLTPTPRPYARMPFYNMMNNRDAYAIVTLRPNPKLTLVSEAHHLSLASASDLWYSGGGAYQPGTFGFAGRPSNGKTGLATVFDLSADATVSPHLSVILHYGHAAGADVVKNIFTRNASGHLGFVETTVRF